MKKLLFVALLCVFWGGCESDLPEEPLHHLAENNNFVTIHRRGISYWIDVGQERGTMFTGNTLRAEDFDILYWMVQEYKLAKERNEQE